MYFQWRADWKVWPIFRKKSTDLVLEMESAVLSLVYLLCTLLITVMLFRNLPLAWRLFSSPHWMVHLKNLKLILLFWFFCFWRCQELYCTFWYSSKWIKSSCCSTQLSRHWAKLQIHIIPGTRVNQDHLHSVIRFAQDRTEAGNTFARTQ